MYTPSPEHLANRNEFGKLIENLKNPQLDPQGMKEVIKRWDDMNHLACLDGEDDKQFFDSVKPFIAHPRQAHHLSSLLKGGRFANPTIAQESVHVMDGYQKAYHELPLAFQSDNPPTGREATNFYVIPQPEKDDLEIDGIHYPQVVIGFSPDGKPAQTDHLARPAGVFQVDARVEDNLVTYPDWLYNIVVDTEGNSRPTRVFFMNPIGHVHRGSVRFEFEVLHAGKPIKGTITDTLMY